MYSTILSVAAFGASAWAQSSSTASATSGSSTGTTTVTGTVPAVGATTDGPAEIAQSFCFPSSWTGPATDTPCYSMEVLNEACFYGPSVFQTATATPTASASPKDQQSCYCDPQNGVGYQYFEFMSGCSTCFRDHGSLGGPGAYSPDFIGSLSSAYCAQASPSDAFGKFLTSFAGSTAVATEDLATSTILGTATDVSLYFTTIPTGGAFSNSTANSTSSATSLGLNSTSVSSTVVSTVTSGPSSAAGASSTGSGPAPTSSSGANAVQLSGFFGAMVIGFAAML